MPMILKIDMTLEYRISLVPAATVRSSKPCTALTQHLNSADKLESATVLGKWLQAKQSSKLIFIIILGSFRGDVHPLFRQKGMDAIKIAFPRG
ncbi:hypothetical protein TSAR_014118 [Trichomalopsis sarcophagae]|uniref:Uncharacterized protein n=1 Tax=Trichomalopsis sarcophagae TaxID=543379 RepID=A0A232FGJ1_9HYME|nr:hypothetical protein TSAR_014118 [Trichomalopsis sarcophagae]